MKKMAVIFVMLVIATIVVAQTVSLDTVFQLAESLGVFDTDVLTSHEKEQPNEVANIRETAQLMFLMQTALNPSGRDAHAKAHACVAAKFKIEKKIPAQLQQGIFKSLGKTFKGIVRFSNGFGANRPDLIPDGRGIAIKLLNVSSEKNILGTGNTQDFLMIDHDRFFVRSIQDYTYLQKVLIQDQKADRFFLYRAIREALADAGRPDAETLSEDSINAIIMGVAVASTDPSVLQNILIKLFQEQAAVVGSALMGKLAQLRNGQAPEEVKVVRVLSRPIGSSLSERYTSLTSYLLGETSTKYVVRPVDCKTQVELKPEPVPSVTTDNYLTDDLKSKVESGDRCFVFNLLPVPTTVEKDERIRLVEDSVLEHNFPEVTVARIKIPQQSVGNAKQSEYCENLSFNPWQALKAHRPLGGLNRARKVAVTSSSIRRHLFNGVGRKEPKSIKDFTSLSHEDTP